MKVTITENQQIEKEIDIELPYYFQHDLSGELSEAGLFGKLTHDKCVLITESQSDTYSFEIEVERFQSGRLNGYSSYLNDKHKSTASIFEAVKRRAIEFLNSEGDSIDF